MVADADILLKVFAMIKKVHKKRKPEERKIKTDSGKRLYYLIQEDISRSIRLKKILKKVVSSFFIILMLILVVKYFV